MIGWFNRSYGFAILILIFLIVICTALFNRLTENYYGNMLPEQIKIKSIINIDNDFACGAVTFLIKDETLEIITREGLTYLDTARTAKQGFWPLPKKTIRYEEWKETPLPENNYSEGEWSSFGCHSELDSDFQKKIISESKKPDSYYTGEKLNRRLIIFPHLKIGMLIYFNN